MMYSFCRSLRGNQIEELPAGVFSNNNKLQNLWVGRLKVYSRPTYFYCKILLQILVNCKMLKYYPTTTSCIIIYLLMCPATIVLRDEPYFLVHLWFKVLQYIFVSDWGRFHHVYISRRREPNNSSSRYTLLKRVRLCLLKFPWALLVFKHAIPCYVILWRSIINNYRSLGQNKIKKLPGNLFAELLNLLWL